MSTAPESFGHYLAAWNERDPDRIREHLDASLTADALFVDPANTAIGPAEIEAMIRRARTSMPTAGYFRTTAADGHNNRYRYRWEIRVENKVVMTGMDVTTLDGTGRIERIDGFFGDFPALADA